MRTVYFYYEPWAEAVAALPPAAIRVFTGPETGDYFRAFASMWAAEPTEDLLCIEQDVAIHPGVLSQLRDCPQDWCSFGWEVSPGQPSFWWLGCTRFSMKLQWGLDLSGIRGHTGPDICAACEEFTPCHRHLDLVLSAVGEHLGQEHPHVHKPDIRHLRA